MSSGWKMALWFVAGAAAGAAGARLMGDKNGGWQNFKPACASFLATGMAWKDNLAAKFAEIKEDLEDMAAEARDSLDAAKMARKPEAEQESKNMSS